MKKWLLIPILLFTCLSVYAQIDSVSISVHTEDKSAFVRHEKFQYLRRSMITEPRLWKVTLQPYATTTEMGTPQYLGNYVYFRNSYRYFNYGISGRIAYERKIGKVVSMMPELITAYSFRGDLSAAFNFSVRYYVGQKHAMAFGKTGNNLLASYLEVRAEEILGFYSLLYKYHDLYDVNRTREVRVNDFGFIPTGLTVSYGTQKRMGKFGFFDVSAGVKFHTGSASLSYGFRSGFEIIPAIKLSWGFATPPHRRLKRQLD